MVCGAIGNDGEETTTALDSNIFFFPPAEERRWGGATIPSMPTFRSAFESEGRKTGGSSEFESENKLKFGF